MEYEPRTKSHMKEKALGSDLDFVNPKTIFKFPHISTPTL